MNVRHSVCRSIALWLCLSFVLSDSPARLIGQTLPQFTRIQRLTNAEVALTLSAPTGAVYRIETAAQVNSWSGLVTLPFSASTTLQHTDAATPYLDQFD